MFRFITFDFALLPLQGTLSEWWQGLGHLMEELRCFRFDRLSVAWCWSSF